MNCGFWKHQMNKFCSVILIPLVMNERIYRKRIFNFYHLLNSKLLTRFAAIRCLFLLSLLVLSVVIAGFQSTAKLKGDEKAISLVQKMLTALGGEKQWKEAWSIKVELTGYYAIEQHAWTETFWLDLTQAYGRFIIKSESKDELIAWTPASGWQMKDGVLEDQDSARHNLEMEYWKRQPIVVFRRLASGVPETRVEMLEDENKFKVIDAASGSFIAQFTVNKIGEPIYWSTEIGDMQMEHVLGPLRKFGTLYFPAWGSTASGMWRYEHQNVSLSKDSPPVSFDPPEQE